VTLEVPLPQHGEVIVVSYADSPGLRRGGRRCV
jgi:hypothetical protein